MILIMGTNNREHDEGSGQFYCPHCRAQRTYVRRRVTSHFTLFFVPVFKLKTLGDYVECQTCHERFNTDVLTYRPPSEMDRLMVAVRADLDAGMPLQMVKQKLINDGIHEVVAEGAIARAATGRRKVCPQCGLAYAGPIRRCSSCGTELVADEPDPSAAGAG